MDEYRNGLLLVALVGCVTLGSSGCAWLRPPISDPLPRVLPPSPSLEQVIGAVNGNSAQIHSFSTNQARLSGPELPVTLRGTSIAFERPRRLRIRAGTGLTGPELDLGSNDELFWIWIRRGQPPAVYYCRHEQFVTSATRQMIPIEPDWLIEALGIVEFDPGLRHYGPFVKPGKGLEVQTILETPQGPAAKITIVDAINASVLEQHVYDAQGRLVASAVASQHRRDPLTGRIMPRVVDVQCPGAQFSMRVNLGNLVINGPVSNPSGLWTMPTYEGWQTVDLGDPNLQLQPAAPMVPPPRYPPATVSSLPRPTRRGWNRLPH